MSKVIRLFSEPDRASGVPPPEAVVFRHDPTKTPPLRRSGPSSSLLRTLCLTVVDPVIVAGFVPFDKPDPNSIPSEHSVLTPWCGIRTADQRRALTE